MQQRSEETRKNIMTSALDLFSKNGYDATGVAEICKLSGVSKGAFYHHFPTKQAVFVSLFEEWLAGLKTDLMAAEGSYATIPEQLIGMSGMFQSIFQMAGGRLPMFLEFWLHAMRDPEIWNMTIQPYRQYRDYFAELFNRGIQEGSLETVEVDAASRVLVALAVGVLLQGLLDPEEGQWDQVVKKGIEYMLVGIQRRKA
jgi:AcrR family transcriptional regulator